jgi:glycosyltransferase involved in cell wall biosynthesis
MGAAQSLETIVEAMRVLKGKTSIKWIMIGDGRRKQWMQDKVKESGLEDAVLFTGRLLSEDMPDYFAHADIMLATLADEEIFSYTIPAKIQTYMACGRPLVVALNGEGSRIVRESGAGYAVPAGDGEALANAVLDFYNKPDEERVIMGKAALEYSDLHFNKRRLISELENILEKTEVAA